MLSTTYIFTCLCTY